MSKFNHRRQVSPPREAERHSSCSVRHTTVVFDATTNAERPAAPATSANDAIASPESFPGSLRRPRVFVTDLPSRRIRDSRFRMNYGTRVEGVASEACPEILWEPGNALLAQKRRTAIKRSVSLPRWLEEAWCFPARAVHDKMSGSGHAVSSA